MAWLGEGVYAADHWRGCDVRAWPRMPAPTRCSASVVGKANEGESEGDDKAVSAVSGRGKATAAAS